MAKENVSHYKKDRLCISSSQPGLGSIPAGGRQPLDPWHRGGSGPRPADCSGGEWGCTSATTARWGIALRVVKIMEKLQMTDTGATPRSRRSLVMGARGWAAATWGQDLPGECQRAASGGKEGSPNPERMQWDGVASDQGAAGWQAAAPHGVHLMAASAPPSTSSPGLLHRLRFIPRLLDQSHLRRGRYHLISTRTYLKYAVMNSPRSFKSNKCDLCMFLP